MSKFFANILSAAALLLSFSSFAESEVVKSPSIDDSYVKASQYKFNTFINGVPLGEVDALLALGVPASITYQDKNGNPTYQVKLLANEYFEDSLHPKVTHVIEQNINGVWIELLQADLVFEESKDANLTVLNKDSVEISIQGFAKFMSVDKKPTQ